MNSMLKYYGSQSPVLGLKHDGIEGCKSYHSFGHSNWKIQSARRGGGFPSCLIQAECHDVSMRNKGRNGSKCKALDIESYRDHSLFLLVGNWRKKKLNDYPASKDPTMSTLKQMYFLIFWPVEFVIACRIFVRCSCQGTPSNARTAVAGCDPRPGFTPSRSVCAVGIVRVALSLHSNFRAKWRH